MSCDVAIIEKQSAVGPSELMMIDCRTQKVLAEFRAEILQLKSEIAKLKKNEREIAVQTLEKCCDEHANMPYNDCWGSIQGFLDSWIESIREDH